MTKRSTSTVKHFNYRNRKAAMSRPFRWKVSRDRAVQELQAGEIIEAVSSAGTEMYAIADEYRMDDEYVCVDHHVEYTALEEPDEPER